MCAHRLALKKDVESSFAVARVKEVQVLQFGNLPYRSDQMQDLHLRLFLKLLNKYKHYTGRMPQYSNDTCAAQLTRPHTFVAGNTFKYLMRLVACIALLKWWRREGGGC